MILDRCKCLAVGCIQPIRNGERLQGCLRVLDQTSCDDIELGTTLWRSRWVSQRYNPQPSEERHGRYHSRNQTRIGGMRRFVNVQVQRHRLLFVYFSRMLQGGSTEADRVTGVPETWLLSKPSLVSGKCLMHSTCIPRISLERYPSTHFSGFRIMPNAFSRSNNWVKWDLFICAWASNGNVIQVYHSYISWTSAMGFVGREANAWIRKAQMKWSSWAWEHPPDELKFCAKPLLDPIRRRLSFHQGMPRNPAKMGLDNDWTSWQHWVRYSHHTDAIRLEFSPWHRVQGAISQVGVCPTVTCTQMQLLLSLVSMNFIWRSVQYIWIWFLCGVRPYN